MAKSYVLTNRKKLDAFMRAGGKIEDLEIRVGILSGKPKYPKGHVGSKSRGATRTAAVRRIDPQELLRRQAVRAGRAQLEGLDKDQRKAGLASMRRLFKRAGLSSRTLSRKRSAATPVARVAGVLNAGDAYHVISLQARAPALRAELQAIVNALLLGANITRPLTAIGRNAKAAIRTGLRRAGHVDTGKLLRNTQYEVISLSGRKRARAEAKEARATKRALKKAAGK